MEALILLSKEESLTPGERRLIRDLLGPGGDLQPCGPTSRSFRQRAPLASSWLRVAPLVLSLFLLAAVAIRWLA
jgi:hypothetical protein